MAEDKPKSGTKGTPAPGGGEHPMVELRRQMDRLFDDFTQAFRMPALGGWGLPAGRDVGSLGPTMGLVDVKFDVSEGDDAIEISAEVPGMSEKDIDVELSGDVLTIKGEKRQDEEKKEQNRYLSERRYGSFQRSFRLPDGVDRDNVDAHFDKGVLKVTLPKTAQAKQQTRKINVRNA